MRRRLSFGLIIGLAVTMLCVGAACATCVLPNQLTNGQVADATQVMANFNQLANCVSVAAAPIVPQGRLTLTSNTPVMSGDQVNAQTVYYDCYAGKLVAYFDGAADQVDTIANCEVSTTMQPSGSGVTNAGGVFDLFWVHSGANRLCVATNGAGAGWAGDAGGSNTQRGTGYSQVHNTRGYWTNANAIAHCYNGSTDYGSIGADQATYLGTLSTTATGQTAMQFAPAVTTGGPNACQCLYNAYNRIQEATESTEGTTNWTYSSGAWRPEDGSASNKISYVDGLRTISPKFEYQLYQLSGNPAVGIDMDSTTATPTRTWGALNSPGAVMDWNYHFLPLLGLHYGVPMEACLNNGCQFYSNYVSAPFNVFGHFSVEVWNFALLVVAFRRGHGRRRLLRSRRR